MITNHMLGQTVFVARCDIPQAPMLKHPIKRCHLKKGILRTDCSHPITPSESKIPAPHSAAVLSSSLLLPCPSMSSPRPSPCRRHRRAAIAVPPLLSPPSPRRHCRATTIAAVIATAIATGKALPCHHGNDKAMPSPWWQWWWR